MFPGANLVSKPSAEPLVDSTEEIEPIIDAVADVEPEPEAQSEQVFGDETVFEAEPVADSPIVDADVTMNDDEDEPEEGDVNGNVEGANVSAPLHPRKPAVSRRKTSGSRVSKTPRSTKTSRPRGGRKSSR